LSRVEGGKSRVEKSYNQLISSYRQWQSQCLNKSWFIIAGHIVNRQYNDLRLAIRDNAGNAPRPFETIIIIIRQVYNTTWHPNTSQIQYLHWLSGWGIFIIWLVGKRTSRNHQAFLKRSPHKITIKLWIDLVRDVEV
jgi:hypothetical protein